MRGVSESVIHHTVFSVDIVEFNLEILIFSQVL